MIFAPSYWAIKGWFSFQDRNTLGWSEGQAREFVEQLRQGIGSELDSMIARVGAMRVKKHEDHMLLEKPEFFKVQTNQRSNVRLHRNGEYQVGRRNSLCG